MEVIETTTILVRHSTIRALANEEQATRTNVSEALETAVDLLEEQRLLTSMDESYRRYGDEIREEMKVWL